MNTYSLSLLSTRGALKTSVKTTSLDPSKHAAELQPCRLKWVDMHSADPFGRVGKAAMMNTVVRVGRGWSNELVGPDEEFVYRGEVTTRGLDIQWVCPATQGVPAVALEASEVSRPRVMGDYIIIAWNV